MSPISSAKLFIQARSFYDGVHIKKIERAKNLSPLQHLLDISRLSKSKNLWDSFRSFGTLQKVGNLNRKSQGKIDRSPDIIETVKKISKLLQHKNIDTVVGGSLAAMIKIPPQND